MTQTINLQIATFAGLGLPRTLNRPVAATTPTCEVLSTIYNVLPNPELGARLIISTTDGRRLYSNSQEPISTFLADSSSILPLRLSSRLCGGKGGFGSQLRAAGGRMSSRKNRDRQNAVGSNRNLDGRRLRTVDEAKRLAQYLEMKPEMDKKERDERRKRLEAVIQAADETEERIKSGKLGSNQGRLNAEYVESKELAEDKMREAIHRAMKDGQLQIGRTGSESSADNEDDDSNDEQESDSSSSEPAKPSTSQVGAGPSFFGWDEDEDDEDDDDDEDEDAVDVSQADIAAQGSRMPREQLTEELQSAIPTEKGKGRAV